MNLIEKGITGAYSSLVGQCFLPGGTFAAYEMDKKEGFIHDDPIAKSYAFACTLAMETMKMYIYRNLADLFY